jgi:hypothetical protein
LAQFALRAIRADAMAQAAEQTLYSAGSSLVAPAT